MLTVRQLTEADAEALRAIRTISLRESPASFGSSAVEETRYGTLHYASMINRDLVVGAFSEAALVGIVRLERYTASKEAHKAVLASMYVCPGYRHQGVASRLVRLALAGASSEIRQINLTVVSDNHPAIGLFNSIGFVIYGIERNSLWDGSSFSDETLMVMFLDRQG